VVVLVHSGFTNWDEIIIASFIYYLPTNNLVVTYFPTYLPVDKTYFLQNGSPRWNQIFNHGEVHPQLSHNGHPMGITGKIIYPCRCMVTPLMGSLKYPNVKMCHHFLMLLGGYITWKNRYFTYLFINS
jgi:hypothetical protein